MRAPMVHEKVFESRVRVVPMKCMSLHWYQFGPFPVL